MPQTKHKQSILKRRAKLRRRKTGEKPSTLLTGKVEPTAELLALIQKLIRDKNRLIEKLASGAPYISCSLAIKLALAKGRKLSLSKLSKVAVKGGPIRIRQKFSKTGKPHKKDVCLKDIEKYIETLPKSSVNESWWIMDKIAREVESQRKAIRSEKEAKHKNSDPK